MICKLCGEEFRNNYAWATHMRNHHPEMATKEYHERFIPPRLCACGCRELTPIRQGNKRAKYVAGHNLKIEAEKKKGVPRSEETKRKISEGRKGIKMSEEAKLKVSKAQSKVWTEERRKEASERVSGENHPNWRGGRPDREGLYRGNTKERVWACRDRDNNTCQMCGATKEENRNRNMAVHHIIPYYDSYNNSLDNLICLCEKCHPIADRGELSKEKILNYYKEV